MELLDKLKAALGLGSRKRSRTEGTTVTVEYDPEAESGTAGTETGGSGSEEPGTQPAGESSAAGTDAAGSTESITEEPPEGKPGQSDEVQSAAEPGEAAGPGPQTGDVDEPAAESADDQDVTGEETSGAATGSGETAVTDTDAEAGDETDQESTETTETEESEQPEGTEGDTSAGSDQVTSLSGIGPAYGERLAEAGIENVGDLRDADAAALADETGLSEKRVARWIERANN